MAATSPRALKAASELFARVAPSVIEMSTREAEFAKMICNTYRYITFAATNQLYMMCEQAGVDIVPIVAENYSHILSIKDWRFNAGVI